mmetsp:Transcript_30116/g.40201  ORF Transcript_30116/g.40201 Transcript_30116/m.40201 type:complete len:552 (+) Transcript_30116:117-1772(+)
MITTNNNTTRQKKTTKPQQPQYYQEDDGGAEKGDERRLARERQHFLSTLLLFFGFMFLLLIYSRSSQHRAAKEKSWLHKTNFYHNQRLKGSKEDGWLKDWKYAGEHNEHEEEDGGKEEMYRWSDARLLPPLPGQADKSMPLEEEPQRRHYRIDRRRDPPMAWEAYADEEEEQHMMHPDAIDYTKHDYTYPTLLTSVPSTNNYPPLEPLGDLLQRWPQDELDTPPTPFVEQLLHFDYQNSEEMKIAVLFRNAELPFKIYNIPEVDLATKKWTDDYVGKEFHDPGSGNNDLFHPMKALADGHADESLDNFFSFYKPDLWSVPKMGPPPSISNDWSYSKWASHARYADKVKLPHNQRHFYWQAGVPREERLQSEKYWTFISRDLPSFSSKDATFFGFNPKEQKGIQCRFGERGVTAATHYDAGRNMVVMIKGAKRYILSPPIACPKLGIVTKKHHPAWRHSLLNFGHMNFLDDDVNGKSMPSEERAWLEIAKEAPSIDTVLKAGEVLYIPSHWFHYITSLQKSAQCNTRSGRHKEGNPHFGGHKDVLACVGGGA